MCYRIWGEWVVFHTREKVLQYPQRVDASPNLIEELGNVEEEYLSKHEIKHKTEKLPLSAKEIR